MQTTYLASKPRYEILDGLRGVAAIIVVIFHLFETYSHGPRFQIVNHGYLAVDFFFVLSGFVIGYAYDDRWDRMTIGGFFKRRLVRLHPMVIMGTLIGALLFYFGACHMYAPIMQTPWWKLLLITLLGCTLLPALPSWDIRGWQEMHPLNGSAWSLFFEYIANILYALVIRHFPKIVLGIFVALSAVLTIDLSFNLNMFGLLGPYHAPYTVIGGWSVTPEQLYIGVSRLLYPFFAGLLLSRMNWVLKVKRGFWWCSLMVAVILALPCLGPADKPWIDGAYNAVVILLLFPLVVSMGAGSKVTGAKSVAVCKWLGEISYPLYITHYPFLYVQMAWAEAHHDAPMGTHIAVAVSVFIIAIAVAQVTLKLYDTPVREWLKVHWLMKSKKTN